MSARKKPGKAIFRQVDKAPKGLKKMGPSERYSYYMKRAYNTLRYIGRQRAKDDQHDLLALEYFAPSELGVHATGTSKVDAKLFSSRVGAHGKHLRHYVFSPEQDPSLTQEEKTARILQALRDWVARYAPDRAHWIAVHLPDKDSPLVHGHLALENYGRDGVGLRFARQAAIDMSQMTFTEAYSAVREDGSPSPTRGAGDLYTHADNTQAMILVTKMRDEGKTLADLIQEGVVAPGRYKGEKMTSVEFGGRRIRIATLRKVADGLPKKEPAKSVAVAPAAAPSAAPVYSLDEQERRLRHGAQKSLIDLFDEAVETVTEFDEKKSQAKGKSR